MNSPESNEPKLTARDLEMQQWLEDREPTPDDIWRRWALIAGILVVVAVIAVGFGYRPLKRLRARKFAQMAETQLVRGELEQSRLSLRKAMGLGMGEPQVLRAVAHYSSKNGLPDAVDFWGKLLATGQATDQDRLEMAMAAMSAGRIDVVVSQAQSLLVHQPQNIEALRLLVRARLLLQNYPGAVEGLRMLVALDPNNERDQMVLARVLLGDTNTVVHADAKITLLGFALSKSTVSGEAIAALAGESDLTDTEIRLLLRKLHDATNAAFADRAIAADLEIRLDRTQTDAVVERTLAGFGGASDTDKISMGFWAAHYDPKRVAEFLTAERISTNRALAALKLETLADSKQWDALSQMLDKATNSIPEAESAWLLARMAADRHKTEDARTYLRSGIRSSKPGQRLLINLAETAESLGFYPEAIEAWEAMAQIPPMVLRSSREIMRLAAIASDLPAVKRAIERLDAFMPDQPRIFGERAVLDAVFNERIVQASAVLAQLLANDPANPIWRDGLALAKLRSGDSAAALALMDEKGFDWAVADLRGKAIYVAVLGAAGQREAARRYARQVPVARLRAAERQLVEPWL